MSPNQQDDQFLTEVIGLFALEGQEWLEQVRAARAEIEQHPSPDQVAKLYETIRRALASLGGSAATVELTAVEQVAHGLLALVESFQGAALPDSSPRWGVFGEGLDALALVLKGLATQGATSVDLEAVRRRMADALTEPEPAGEAGASASPLSPTASVSALPSAGSPDVMQMLLALRHRPDPQSRSRGRVLDMLLARLQSQSWSSGDEPDSATALRLVSEFEGQEQAFLDKLQQQLPQLLQGLAVLKSLAGGGEASDEQIGQLIEEAEDLKEAAASVEAVPVAQFFDGLMIFARVLSRHRSAVLPQRVETVEMRLNEVRQWAEQWMEAGRLERAAIQETLCR